ncbi:MAG: hypothetical protein M3Q83_00350 [Pseudomonadota bacterium]|nr:hypothetical protein [Pseudomonadota bacterium]
MNDRFDYRLFGLHVRSDIALPELVAGTAMSEPDVVISIGPVPGGLPQSAAAQRHGEGVLLTIKGIAHYWVAHGSKIVVEPNTAVAARDVRLFLLGSAMGMLLHQRGLLPLHANAVEIDGRAYAFMGHSGAGKSTLAAWFHDQGHRVIADDVCVVNFDGQGRTSLVPGLPRLRLWRGALEASGRNAAAYEPSFGGDDGRDKFDVPLDGGSVDQSQPPLRGVYLLVQGEKFHIERLGGIDAAEAVFANTYRGAYLDLVERSSDHWQACINLVGQIPIYRIGRRWGLEQAMAQNQLLLDHLRNDAD